MSFAPSHLRKRFEFQFSTEKDLNHIYGDWRDLAPDILAIKHFEFDHKILAYKVCHFFIFKFIQFTKKSE